MSRELSRFVIAIDGPAGAGKSTVSKALARELGLRYLNTGAMYRALALKASRVGVSDRDGDAAAHLMETSTIDFGHGDPPPVFLDGEDVSVVILSPEISESASRISEFAAVRKAMVALQQQMVSVGGVVLEGRDATTVIAPDADVKVFLTASLEERAKRRTLEYDEKGQPVEFRNVRHDMQQRDHRDITREDSPLTVAPDAHIIESGGISVSEVVDRIKQLVG
ncbi:MAG: (d)CMP kinase [Fimbriimonas sp.]|nr:(d)CMP kinase [Fimbriimonas sp.]